ncbi:MAG: TetR/AcrR family transcriptional regulator [Labedaea sp.]
MTGPDRPLRADARRNRDRVLDVAQEVFAADGLAVPIDEIARRAGVGVGTVYRHFPTKEALYEAIVLDRIQRLTAVARAAEDTSDPGSAFFTFFTCMIDAGAVNKALFETLGATGGFDRAAVTAAATELLRTLGELLVRAQRSGAVRADIEVADLRAIMAGALAMERQAAGAPGRMAAIVCDGLRPVRPSG